MSLEVTAEQLESIWEGQAAAHMAQDKRQDYYDGKHAKRPGGDTYADGNEKSNRFANWIKFGINRYVGAMTATPYQVTNKDEKSEGKGPALYADIVEANGLNAQDVENLRRALLMGYAVEVHEFVDSEIVIYNDDPQNWAFIEDDRGDVVAAIRQITLAAGTVHQGEILENERTLMTYYDDAVIVDYRRSSESGAWEQIGEPRKHLYKRVPVVRWKIEDDCKGIVSDALIGQQDEYNDVDSASGDDIKIGVDALLLMFGFDAEWIKKHHREIQAYRMIPLPDKDSSDAKYLIKSLDVAPIESRLTRTRGHIHAMMEVPDIEQIVGVTGGTSGIALKLKFLPMMQAAGAMMHYLKAGMRERIGLINAVRGPQTKEIIDDYVVTIQFTLPINTIEQWTSIGSLSGIVSHRTMLEFLEGIDDPERELDRVASETSSVIGDGGPEDLERQGFIEAEAQAQMAVSVDQILKKVDDVLRDGMARAGILERTVKRAEADKAKGAGASA